jgi:hypothetical protein
MVQLRKISSEPPPARAAAEARSSSKSLHSLNTEELRAEVERLRAVAAAAAAAQAAQQAQAPLEDVAEGDEGDDEESARQLGCAPGGVRPFMSRHSGAPARRRRLTRASACARRPWAPGEAPPRLPPGVEEVEEAELTYKNGDTYKVLQHAGNLKRQEGATSKRARPLTRRAARARDRVARARC